MLFLPGGEKVFFTPVAAVLGMKVFFILPSMFYLLFQRLYSLTAPEKMSMIKGVRLCYSAEQGDMNVLYFSLVLTKGSDE